MIGCVLEPSLCEDQKVKVVGQNRIKDLNVVFDS